MRLHTANNTAVGLQGLNTADTAPPHLHAINHYASSVQPAPTELNVSGISPAQPSHYYLNSTHAAAGQDNSRAASTQRKARLVPCGTLSCGLLTVLALMTAGAWTFAGLCIHRIGGTDIVDVAWERRKCTVRSPPLMRMHCLHRQCVSTTPPLMTVPDSHMLESCRYWG